MGFDGRLYTGFLKRATRAAGLHTHLKSAYWGLRIPRLLHGLSRRESIVHDVNGTAVEFPVEEYWQYRRFRWMHPEIRMFEELVADLGPDDSFYDVGAHLGWHALVAAATDAEVVAFEPHPTTADRLSTVVEASDATVDVRPVALADETGTAAFSADPSAAAYISGTVGREPSEAISVDTVRGDRLVAAGEVPSPDVLKIDAEGAEAAVLRGLRETITSRPPRTIYCEIHDDGGDVEALLDEFGYEYEPLGSARPIIRAVPA